MAVNPSTYLGLALPDQGEWDGTWGTNTNQQITELIDSAIAGTTTLSVDADATLSDSNFIANESRQAIILWTASNGATTRNVTAPAHSKAYVVVNAGTGSIVLRGAGPTTGITIVAGEKCVAAWDGSDFVKVASSLVSQLSGTLDVANGGTGLTTTPANGELDIGNGTGFTRTTLTAGTNVSITNGPGSITINATGSGGSVSSVDVSGGTTGLTTSGGPITSSGTITLAGTLGVANGGTGLSSLTAGYIPYGNGTSAFGSAPTFNWDSANGRLGVGTTFPSVTLHVAGTGASTARAYIESSSSSGSGSPSLALYRSSSASMPSQFIGSVAFTRALTDTTIQTAFQIQATGSNSSSTPVCNVTYSSYTSHAFQIQGVTKAFLDSSGNFGVGVTPVANNGVLQLGSYASVQAMMEKATVSATAATGTIDFDAATQPVLYYTTNSSANWTLNIRGSASLSLNSMMQTGQSLTLAFLATNGATAYYQSALTIDGSSVTPKWQGGTAPTSGNINSIDAYVLTVIKTGSATFTVLANQNKFA